MIMLLTLCDLLVFYIVVSEGWNWSTIVRPSLFPEYLPSTIKFSVSNNDLPKGICNLTQKHFLWKDTPFINYNIKKLLINSGFRIVGNEEMEVHKHNRYIGIWNTHSKTKNNSDNFHVRKANHFPQKFLLVLGRKDRFHQFIQRSSPYSKNPYEFIPRTFILHDEIKDFKRAWKKSSNKLWIVKPPLGSNSKGIKIINNPKQLRQNESLIIQEYISNYFLLNNSRAVLTTYVVLTSIKPLRVYLYKDGLVSLRSSLKFLYKESNMTNESIAGSNCTHVLYDTRFLHDRDKECSKIVKQMKIIPRESTFLAYKSFLSNLTTMGYNTKALEIKIRRSLEFVFSSLNYELQKTPTTYNEINNAYELLSVDYILDKDLNPWLLEFNRTPMLKYSEYFRYAPVFESVRLNMLAEMMNLVGYEFPCTFPEQVLRNIASDTNQVFATLCHCFKRNLLQEIKGSSLIRLLEQEESQRKGDNLERILLEF